MAAFARKEVRDLDDEELQEVRWAFHLLQRQDAGGSSRFNELAGIHRDHCHTQGQAFLPWHRRYVNFFEEELRRVYDADVAANGRPANVPEGFRLALPYWNWASVGGKEEGLVPAAFTFSGNVPTGRAAEPQIRNPLWIAARGPTATTQGYLQDNSRDGVRSHVVTSLSAPVFVGGQMPWETQFHRALEGLPHNNMHVWIGGWMGWPPTAAFDPIFWFHHCNVDRLWVVWMNTHADQHDLVGRLAKVWASEATPGNPGRALHYAGMDNTLGEADLVIEATVGKPGVSYVPTAQADPPLAVVNANLHAVGDRYDVVVPFVSELEGSYRVHVFLVNDKVKRRPVTIADAYDARFDNLRATRMCTFKKECKCTPEELSAKDEVPLWWVQDCSHVVNRLVSTPETSMPFELSKFQRQERSLPKGYDFVVIIESVPASSVDPATVPYPRAAAEDEEGKGDAPPASGAGEGGASESAAATDDTKTPVAIKTGTVTKLPWNPYIHIEPAEKQVQRSVLSLKDSDEFPDLPADWSQEGVRALVGADLARGVRVALVDSGVDRADGDLKGAFDERRIIFRDFTRVEATTPEDCLGHGTLSARLIVGEAQGLARNATLFVARVCVATRDTAWDLVEAAIQWAIENDVHVICLPLAGPRRHVGVYRALHHALGAGAAVIASAGVEAISLGAAGAARPSGAAGPPVLFPASVPGVVAVAAAWSPKQCTHGYSTETGSREPWLLGDKSKDKSEIDAIAPASVRVSAGGANGRKLGGCGSSVSAALVAGLAATTIGKVCATSLDRASVADRPIVTAHELLSHLGISTTTPFRTRDKVIKPGPKPAAAGDGGDDGDSGAAAGGAGAAAGGASATSS